MDVDPFRVPLLIGGIGTIAVGLAILGAKIATIPRRPLAALFVLKGSVLALAGLTTAIPVAWVGPLVQAQAVLTLPIIILVALAASAYIRVPGFLRGRRGTLAAVGAILLLEAIYALAPDAVFSLARSSGATGLSSAGPSWVYTGYGPLVWLLALSNAALALLAILFARQATRGESHNAAVSFWFAVGFTVNGIFDGGMAIAYLIHDPAIGGVSGLGWVLGIARSLALLPAGIALGILVGAELAKTTPQRWRWALPSVLALAAWFSGPMPVIFGAADYGQTWPTAIATGMWRTVLAAMVGIGLWQHWHTAPADTRTPMGASARPAAEEL